MINPMEELEYEVYKAFEKLDKGEMPSKSEVMALKFACGYTKPHATTMLDAIFNDFGKIFTKEEK